MPNLPSSPYGDNIIPLFGLDQPRAQGAIEIAPGTFVPKTVHVDSTGAIVTPAGSRGSNGPANSFLDTLTQISSPVLLHATSAVKVANGVIGAGAGSAYDSMLVAVCILKDAGPCTLTVAGFMGEDGLPRNVVFQGSTTVDSILPLSGLGLVNSGGPMTLTASVADKVLVGVRPTGTTFNSQAMAPGTAPLTMPQVIAFGGQAPQVLPGTQRGPTVGSASFSSNIAPTVTIVPADTPTVGALTFSGIAPVVTARPTMVPTAGALTLAGTQIAYAQGPLIKPAAGSVFAQTHQPVLSQ